MADIYTISYSWRLRINAPNTWRESFGAWMDRLATRIDGRFREVYKIETDPHISRSLAIECITSGRRTIKASLELACRGEAEELLLRRVHPELIEAD